jgi:hypothetical protein
MITDTSYYKDSIGRLIFIGDAIVYPTRRASFIDIHHAIVVGFDTDKQRLVVHTMRNSGNPFRTLPETLYRTYLKNYRDATIIDLRFVNPHQYYQPLVDLQNQLMSGPIKAPKKPVPASTLVQVLY